MISEGLGCPSKKTDVSVSLLDLLLLYSFDCLMLGGQISYCGSSPRMATLKPSQQHSSGYLRFFIMSETIIRGGKV